jgi:hypothetical protein
MPIEPGNLQLIASYCGPRPFSIAIEIAFARKLSERVAEESFKELANHLP